MHLYHVNIENQVQNIISVLPPEKVQGKDLPLKSIVGKLLKPVEQGGELIYNNFISNSLFTKFMHEVIVKYAPQLKEIQDQAKQQQNGWLYIIDLRRPNSERSDPLEDMLEDTIGAFKVNESQLLPESYQPITEHKILSARGFFKLNSQLHEYIIDECLM